MVTSELSHSLSIYSVSKMVWALFELTLVVDLTGRGRVDEKYDYLIRETLLDL